MKKSLAVIGSTSMVGLQFCEQFEGQIVKGNYPQVDITKSDLVEKFFAANQFDTIILFSAATNVNAVEAQRDHKDQPCWQINVAGAENVAGACAKYNRKIIFISTDFIFDGASGPYKEADPTGPDLSKVSWYGITKIEGEKIIATLPNHIILRIAYPYSGKDMGKDDLVLRIIKLYRQGELYPMYTDQIITPTYIPDIASAMGKLLAQDFKGIVHLASPSATSQFEFAKELIDKAKIQGPKPLEQKSIDEDLAKPSATPRPKKGGLAVDKIRSLGFTPTDWKAGIDKSIKLWLK